MFQLFPKAISGVGYGTDAGTQRVGVVDGLGSATQNVGRAPMAAAGTLRNLMIYCGVSHPQVKVEILIDNVLSGVGATLGTGQTSTNDLLHEVVYTQGQTLTYLLTVVEQTVPGFELSLCVELESDANVFGVVAQFASSVGVGTIGYAGALGNGYWAGNRSSYSINALNGSVTTLVLRRHVAQSGGSWKANLEVDTGAGPVLQDGSLGTIDTTCELLDSEPSGILAVPFDLPVTPAWHVNIVLERLGTDAAFGFEQVGAGVAFVPGVANQFMCCGGSNDVIPIGATTSWKWNHSREQGPSILMHHAPIGQRSVSVSALYVEHSVNPGTGEAFTDTLLKNDAVTDISVVVADAADSGQDSGNVIYAPEDFISIRLDSTAGANNVAKFYWGLGAIIVTGPQRGNIGPIAWLDWTRRQP